MSASSAHASIRFGRPPKLTKHQQTEALRLLDEGEPQAAVARLLGVDQSTISRLAALQAARGCDRSRQAKLKAHKVMSFKPYYSDKHLRELQAKLQSIEGRTDDLLV